MAFKTDTRISGVRVVGGGFDRDVIRKSPIALFSSLDTFLRDARSASVSMTLVLAESDLRDGRISIRSLICV